MSRRNVQWLYRELPDLVDTGVIDDAAAGRVRQHYGEVTPVPISKVALVAFGVFGALLIGTGVILIFAHNWDQFPRNARTALSFLPLLVAQGLVILAAARHINSRPWMETTTTLLILAIGSAIALIGQIYHMEPNLASFLLTWLCLSLPLVYLCRSTMAAMLTLILLLFYARSAHSYDNHALLYWPLAAILAPFIVHSIRKAPQSPWCALLTVAVCIHLTIAPAVVLQKDMPGLWIVCYSALYGILRLAWSTPGKPTAAGKILALTGFVGTMALALLFTERHPWSSIGWRHYHYYSPNLLAGMQDYAATIAFAAVFVFLALVRHGDSLRRDLPWRLMPLCAVVAYAGNAQGMRIGYAQLFFNLYVLFIGLFELAAGLRSARLLRFNTGMFALAGLAWLRFDYGMDLLLRGVLFVAVGLLFLGGNFLITRRKNAAGEELS